jgi:hypothetical protein
MTSISQTAAPARAQAAPKSKARNAALDRARTFITMLVLIHHSVIAYTYYGHTACSSGRACSARASAGSCVTAGGGWASPSSSACCC